MASSNYITFQYTSEEFVESCGAVLFSIPESKVCLVKYTPTDEWLLPKGRRNCGESRKEAALREVSEETGYDCDLYPVTMSTRAPSKTEMANVADQARTLPSLTEPFMVTIRNLEGSNQKFIWWYIAALSKDAAINKSDGEDDFTAEFISWEEAVQTLTFRDDRIVLERAVELVKGSLLNFAVGEPK